MLTTLGFLTGLTSKEKEKIRLFGRSLRMVGSIILGENIPRDSGGVFDPIGYSSHHLELAKTIYGQEIEVLECEFWGKNEWIIEIKKLYPTPKSFMSLNQNEKQNFKIGGKGLRYISAKIIPNISSRFNPTESTKNQALLAQLIYGEGIEMIEHEFWGEEKWIEEIRKLYETPEEFMNLNQKEKKEFKIYGKGLLAIGSILLGKDNTKRESSGGNKFNPISYTIDHARIARTIYGQGLEIIECEFWGKNEWIDKIRLLYPKREDFITLTQQQRLKFKLLYKTLANIGFLILGDIRLKDKEGRFNPTGHLTHHTQLAQAIYGDENS